MEKMIFDLVIRTFGSALAIFGFAIVLNTPKKYLLRSAMVGAVSGLAYFGVILLGGSEVVASFWSAFTVAFVSHILARAYKVPVTLFLVAGMLPTVPGGGMYRTVRAFIEGKTEATSYYLQQVLAIAGVIALAIFVVDSLFTIAHNGEWKQNSLKYVRILKPAERDE